MLAEILINHRGQLAALADAWLMIGATTFSLHQNGEILAKWPTEACMNDQVISAPIRIGQKTWGELRVTGYCHATAQAQLAVEASMISHLVELEAELEIMTAELVENQDQLLTLYNLAQSTRSRLNIGEIIGSLSKEIKRLVNAEGVFIIIGLPQQPLMMEQQPNALVSALTMQQLFEQIHESEQELLLPAEDINDLPVEITSLFLKLTPVRADVMALIGVLFAQPAASLSPNLKLVRAIAEHTGAQLANALLHKDMLQQARLKTELELAAQIQFQLLPQKSPAVAGLDIAARSRPALQVGGDFYDFIAPVGWPFTFAIGDVSGKGMSAALLMAMTRTVIRSKASSLPTPTPEVVLGYSNEIMYDDFTEVGMFATVFVGWYDPDTRSLFYANAGHSPVIYCPADGSSILLEADGPAMGVLPLSLSENHKIHFQPDDLLVITTDGFNEASNSAGEMFGMTRLLQLIDSVASISASEISAAIFKAVQDFSAGRPQDDDQTLVIIKGKSDE